MPVLESRTIRRCLLPVLGVVFLAACGKSVPSGEDAPLEVVDVEPSVEISSADDPKEVRRAPTLSGALPGSFPSGLPIHLPASVVDIGQTESGSKMVTLVAEGSLAGVESGQLERLRGAGWTVLADGSGRWRLERSGTAVTMTLIEGKLGTELRFEYR